MTRLLTDVTATSELRERRSHEVAAVWSGTSAAFDLYTHDDRQFVAFYDPDRTLTVGQRVLDEVEWTFARLPEDRKVKWDAHNYVTLAVDDDGHLHLSGNMHNHPLKYWRTAVPLDVATFERLDEMVGAEEDSVTYPTFLRGPADELVFTYRDGYSGGGNWLYNVYDSGVGEWQRLLDEPLTYGGDRMNAYPHGPVVGPDGYSHLCWVWRDHGGAQTNHDLSYARSPDMRSWETSRGEPLELPLTVTNADLVDPVPTHGGMINGNTKLGFDADGRVIVSYHKFDPDGNTQVYNARCEGGEWVIHRTSDWDYRWAFGGGGSIPFEIQLGPVEVQADGRLSQTYRHAKYGRGKWLLDEDSLQPVEWRSPWYRYPEGLETLSADDPAVQVNWAEDSGEGPDDVVYALRWEALGPNRDRVREAAPTPTTLTLHAFEARD